MTVVPFTQGPFGMFSTQTVTEMLQRQDCVLL